MGGKSTSQGAVLGNDTGNKKHDYDLLSWQGVAEVLKDGREFLKEPLVYAEFRNLVLAYSRSGGDKELKQKIDPIIASFEDDDSEQDTSQGTPVSIEKTENTTTEQEQEKEELESKIKTETTQVQQKSEKPLGRKRATPSFMPKHITPVEKAEPKSEPPQQEQVEVLNEPPHNIPVVSEPPKLKPEHKSLEEDQVKSKSVQPSAPKETPIEPSSNDSQTEDAQSQKNFSSIDEYRTRITEIKRDVHEKIGNPAALVDTYNDEGRQYMTALLTALKALTPGGPVGIEKAMADLESTYTKLLDADKFGTTEKATSSNSKSSDEPEKKNETEEKKIESAPKQVAGVDKSKPLDVENQANEEEDKELSEQTESTKEPIASEKEEKSEKKSAPSPEPKDSTEPPRVSQQEETKPTQAVSEPKTPTRTPGSIIASLIQADDLPNVAKGSQGVPQNERKETPPLPKKPAPLPKEQDQEPSKQVEVPEPKEQEVAPPTTSPEPPLAAQSIESDTPVPGSVKTKVQQSELSTPELNKALHELLDEWPLFAGSGIFGMGPGGYEHPLYKQLSMLSMGEVLAGRWDKADPKVIKTVKEYINAWRHEQGIAYTINETFEHYLRRVVQRILKRQNH